MDFLANQTILVDLVAKGIPEAATILDIAFHPQIDVKHGMGVIWPLEVGNFGNSYQRVRISRPKAITLYAMPQGFIMPDTQEIHSPPREQRLLIEVYWINPGEEAGVSRQLVAAFLAFWRQEFEQTVLPANAAVEAQFARLLTDLLTPIVPKLSSDEKPAKTIKDFLAVKATYSSQLKVLLPLLTTIAGVAPLDNTIHRDLVRLNSERHKIAHAKDDKPNLSEQQIAKNLRAALFGVAYLDWAEPKIRAACSTSPPPQP